MVRTYKDLISRLEETAPQHKTEMAEYHHLAEIEILRPKIVQLRGTMDTDFVLRSKSGGVDTTIRGSQFEVHSKEITLYVTSMGSTVVTTFDSGDMYVSVDPQGIVEIHLEA
jgi:hypothetical protein